jgi:purine-binding chemotaxis protein CheW
MAASLSGPDVDERRLVFRVGEQRHEIDARHVLEVVRVPHITRVPHGPDALAGIANLRGRPVPVLSMSRILDCGPAVHQSDGRIIVYDHGETVGLLVDDVLRLSADTVSMPLQGLAGLLDASFKIAQRKPTERAGYVATESEAQAGGKLTALLTFRVAGQLCGLPLQHIREVGALSGEVTTLPNTTTALIGLVSLRDTVLPLISISSLLGLEITHSANDGSYMIIVEHEGDLIGLVVDEVDVIRRLPEHSIDVVPSVLQRGRGDGQISAIGRIAEEGLLIAILSPEKLFGRHAVAQAIEQNAGARSVEAKPDEQDAAEQLLIFQLGQETYGLPIAAVDEVVRVPNEITRVPGAPGFVMGVINLRGKAIALIDQRTRFDTPATQQTAKVRAIILTLGSLQAGFVVDGVSEVKAVSLADLSAAPEFSSGQTDVFDRIAHVESDGRMVLLIDPQELLTRAERDIVTAVASENVLAGDP